MSTISLYLFFDELLHTYFIREKSNTYIMIVNDLLKLDLLGWEVNFDQYLFFQIRADPEILNKPNYSPK